jgi:predicted RNA binding protein YcfA (HicA-like mRNA interferase family)
MSQMPELTAQDLIGLLNKYGWREHDSHGSHRLFRHPAQQGLVTVPDHAGKSVPIETVKRIFTHAGMLDAFRRLQKGTPWRVIEKSAPQPAVT